METDLIRNAVLATIARIAPETEMQSLRPDRPLREQLDLDSMDWVNLIAGLHERLHVDIPESDYARLTTLDAVVAYLASRAAAPAGEPHPPMTGAPAELPYAHYVINGTAITVRPIRAADAALEADFVRHLSTDSRYSW
jgi:acyl carrier protein